MGAQLSCRGFPLEIYLRPGSYSRQDLTDGVARKETANLREKCVEYAEFQKVQRTERGQNDEHFHKMNQRSLDVMEIM